MNNVIMSMIAKISKMDVETKELTAQVEAQSLMLSAILLSTSKNGGMSEFIDSVKKAINIVLDSSEVPLKSDAELLLLKFNELITLTRLMEKADTEIDTDALRNLPADFNSD